MHVVKSLLALQQPRGDHAAGVAWFDDGNIVVHKQKGKPDDFIKRNSTLWPAIVESPIVLLHARNRTQGSEDNNVNNHPIEHGRWVVTHNGTLKNDKDIFEHYNEKRFAEVDTAALPVVLKQGSSFDRSLDYLSIVAGTATAAMWSIKEPEKLALTRLGKHDLYLFIDQQRRIFYWSSVPSAAVLMPSQAVSTLLFTTFSKLPDERIMVLSPAKEGFGAQMLKVNRRPFFRTRLGGGITKSGSQTTSPGSGKTEAGIGGETGANSNTNGSTSGSTGLKYEQAAKDQGRWRVERFETAVWKNKPLPQMDRVPELSFHYFDIERARLWLYQKTEPVRTGLELFTPYGRWIVEPAVKHDSYRYTMSNQHALNRKFKPTRSNKRWIQKTFAKKGIGLSAEYLRLPDVAFTTVLKDMMPLEMVTMITKVGTSESHIFGYMCPWCGHVGSILLWDSNKDTCHLCEIKSRRVVKGG